MLTNTMCPKLRRTACLALLLSCALFPRLVQGAAGDLDPSFGTGGIVTTDFGFPFDSGSAVFDLVLQADGKLVAVGETDSSTPKFAIARYNSDGSLDTSFGTGGKVTTLVSGSTSRAFAVAYQADGKLVVAGQGAGTLSALARYASDGALDSAFGNGGVVVTNFGGSGFPQAVVLQADGKIVTAGSCCGFARDFVVARYNSDGSLDTSFGTSGIATTDFSTSEDRALSLVLQNDGRIVAAGDAGSMFAIARYNSDGSLDTSFGTGGKVTTTAAVRANALVLQSDGKLVAGGATLAAATDFLLVRYNPDGSVDAGFGTGGRAIADLSATYSATVHGLVMQSDGKIVAAGAVEFPRTFGIARFNTDGSVDASFGNGGVVRTSAGADGAAAALDIVLQTDGKLVAAGMGRQSTQNDDFALARYIGGGVVEPTPSTPTQTVTSTPSTAPTHSPTVTPSATATSTTTATPSPTATVTPIPQTFHVTKTLDTRDGSCDSDCSLREAIIAANSHPGRDLVSVPQGIYLLQQAGEEDNAAAGDLDIRESLDLTGAGSSLTIIDGNLTDRIFQVHGAVALNIREVTLRNGRPPPGQDGGAIYSPDAGAELVLSNCELLDNSLRGDVLTNRLGSGGGIYASDNDVRLSGSTLRRNSAMPPLIGGPSSGPGVDGRGGGVFARGGSLAVADCWLEGNQAWRDGGAIYTSDGEARVVRSVITRNSASVDGFGGGGIFNGGGTLALDEASIIENRSGAGGGGVRNQDGEIHAVNSAFIGNYAAGDGGGVLSVGPFTTLDRCTVTMNSVGPSASGGGIWASGGCLTSCGHLRILHSSVGDNSAGHGLPSSPFSGQGGYGGHGGGIFTAAETTTISSSLLFQNSAGDGGSAANPGWAGTGGAIYKYDGSLSIAESDLSSNRAGRGGSGRLPKPGGDGGAIYNRAGPMTISNTAFVGNLAGDSGTDGINRDGDDFDPDGGNGGAVYNAGSSVTIVQSVIAGNKAGNGHPGSSVNQGGRGGHGGAIYEAGDSLLLEECVIESNEAGTGPSSLPELGLGSGGAIYVASSELEIRASTVRSNSGGLGGAAFLVNGSLNIVSSSMLQNASSSGGALVIWTGGRAQILRGVFRNNRAVFGVAGAILNSGGQLKVDESLLVGNSGSKGGGIYNDGGLVELNNCTITGNSGLGSGIFNETTGFVSINSSTVVNNLGPAIENSAQVSVGNSLIAASSGSRSCSSAIGMVSRGYNIDTDGGCGFFNSGDLSIVSAEIAPLADYGGPTLTHALCAASGVPHPDCVARSPAIDAGSTVECPAIDQRGGARPQGDGCDIGAYEVAATGIEPTVTPTVTRTPTLAPVPTGTLSATPSPSPTATDHAIPSVTPEVTLPETPTPTSSPTLSLTPTDSATPTLTNTPTLIYTPTPTITQTPATIRTPTQTSTPTSTTPSTYTPTMPTRTATAAPSETPTATATPILTCVGDCGDDGAVTVNEIIRGVNIALGNATVASCAAFDVNDDDAVTVDELVKAVNAALNGCSG